MPGQGGQGCGIFKSSTLQGDIGLAGDPRQTMLLVMLLVREMAGLSKLSTAI
jgi:hypothetical protein